MNVLTTLEHRVKGADGPKVPSDRVPKLGLVAGDMLVLGENRFLFSQRCNMG